jgi:hypothetical protein
MAKVLHRYTLVSLKGQSHEIFDPWFFSLNGIPGSPDSWAKTVLNVDSNSHSAEQCCGSGIHCFFTPRIWDPDPGCFYTGSWIRLFFV